MRRFLLPTLLAAVATCATLTVQPARASIPPGAALQLMAVGAAPVVWTVVESGGGTVDATGVYTAPPCPTTGTFHVQATAGGQVATVSVIVVDAIASVTVSPPTGVNLAPGKSQQFTATVRTVCGVVSTSP